MLAFTSFSHLVARSVVSALAVASYSRADKDGSVVFILVFASDSRVDKEAGVVFSSEILGELWSEPGGSATIPRRLLRWNAAVARSRIPLPQFLPVSAPPFFVPESTALSDIGDSCGGGDPLDGVLVWKGS